MVESSKRFCLLWCFLSPMNQPEMPWVANQTDQNLWAFSFHSRLPRYQKRIYARASSNSPVNGLPNSLTDLGLCVKEALPIWHRVRSGTGAFSDKEISFSDKVGLNMGRTDTLLMALGLVFIRTSHHLTEGRELGYREWWKHCRISAVLLGPTGLCHGVCFRWGVNSVHQWEQVQARSLEVLGLSLMLLGRFPWHPSLRRRWRPEMHHQPQYNLHRHQHCHFRIIWWIRPNISSSLRHHPKFHSHGFSFRHPACRPKKLEFLCKL